MSSNSSISKKLVIAEKPSYARLIVQSLPGQKFQRQDGFYEGSRLIVTYAFGHLFEAYDIQDYLGEAGARWTLDILPFCPPEKKFYYSLIKRRNNEGKKVVDPGVKKQFAVIKALIARRDVAGIIHAGDADREGEIIVRQILRNANPAGKPVERLWVSEQNEKEIFDKINHLVPDSQYDNLANEGFARSRTDWLDGINLTRYVSIKSKAPAGKPFRLGRVICAMVREIYDRDMEIANFVPVKYWAVVSEAETNGQKIVLRCKDTYPYDKKEDAESKCVRLNACPAVVNDIKTERKTIGAGKLFSLTTLQNALLKRHHIPLDVSTAIIQKLYESGYITYPRTNTEYLGESEKDKVRQLIGVFRNAGYEVVFKDGKSIFDSSKVESHSAIIPTYKIPSGLIDNEKKVYETVRNRFLAVFCEEPCLVDRTIMDIQCAEDHFVLKGDVRIQDGFTKYDPVTISDKMLPNLQVGDVVATDFQAREEETKPPKHYTAVTFNNFLENPFRKEKADAEEGEQDDREHYDAVLKGVEIGTVASRADIIKKIINNRYIDEKKGTYYIAPTGKYLIETMERLGIEINKHTTANMSMMLKKVNHGEMTMDEAIDACMENLKKIMQKRDVEIPSCIDAGVVEQNGAAIGICPKCGGEFVLGKFGPYCKNKCGFSIRQFKDKKFTDKQIADLLAGKKVLLKGLLSKAGDKLYDAYIVMKKDDIREYTYEKDGQTVKAYAPAFDMEFPKMKRQRSIAAKGSVGKTTKKK